MISDAEGGGINPDGGAGGAINQPDGRIEAGGFAATAHLFPFAAAIALLLIGSTWAHTSNGIVCLLTSMILCTLTVQMAALSLTRSSRLQRKGGGLLLLLLPSLFFGPVVMLADLILVVVNH